MSDSTVSGKRAGIWLSDARKSGMPIQTTVEALKSKGPRNKVGRIAPKLFVCHTVTNFSYVSPSGNNVPLPDGS